MPEIRKAAPGDALGITIVNVYTWKTAYAGLVPEELIDRRIAELLPRAEKCRLGIEQGGDYWVAAEGNAVVGFCMFGSYREADHAGAGEIYALYTLAGYQRRGAGTALFTAAVETLKAREYPYAIVNCLRGNPALTFYQNRGGTVIGRWEDDSSGFRLEGDTLRFEL